MGDIATGHVSWSFGQNQTAYVAPVHFDWLHGPILQLGVKHHIAVHLWEEQ